MRPFRPARRLILFATAAALTAGVVWTLALAQEPAAPDPVHRPQTEAGAGAGAQDLVKPDVQRFIPDDSRPNPWRPVPRDDRVIEAQTIVLSGRDCRITLSATGPQPGVTVENKRGCRFLVYFGRDGEPVVGLTTPARRELTAGLFTTKDDRGVVQFSDRWGIHVFDGRELERAASGGRGTPMGMERVGKLPPPAADTK